jgi:hypothetical protein
MKRLSDISCRSSRSVGAQRRRARPSISEVHPWDREAIIRIGSKSLSEYFLQDVRVTGRLLKPRFSSPYQNSGERIIFSHRFTIERRQQRCAFIPPPYSCCIVREDQP